jgi:hypothetical protein
VFFLSCVTMKIVFPDHRPARADRPRHRFSFAAGDQLR